jgi:hypothetical protein
MSIMSMPVVLRKPCIANPKLIGEPNEVGDLVKDLVRGLIQWTFEMVG